VPNPDTAQLCKWLLHKHSFASCSDTHTPRIIVAPHPSPDILPLKQTHSSQPRTSRTTISPTPRNFPSLHTPETKSFPQRKVMPKRNFQLPTLYPISKRWELTADKKHVSIKIPMMTYDMTALIPCYSGNCWRNRSVKLVSSSPSLPKLHRINLFPSTPLTIANVRAAIIITRVLLRRKLDCKAQTRR
jgi:hypothetical protein